MNSHRQPLLNHFRGQAFTAEKRKEDDNAFEILINDYAILLQGGNGFGLAYTPDIPFHLTLNKNKLDVQSIIAISRNGEMIIHERKLGLPEISISLPANSIVKEEYLIFIEICGERRGWNFPSDNDLNPKYRVPVYNLVTKFTDEETNKFTNAICIAKIKGGESDYELCGEFIPACINLYAHPILERKLLWYQTKWHLWQKNTGHIIRETLNVPHDAVLQDVNRLATSVGNYLSKEKFVINSLIAQSHPFELVRVIGGLANVLQFHFSELSPQKDALLKFLEQYTLGTAEYIFSPIRFIQAIESLADYQFDQQNLTEGFSRVDNFIQAFGEAWELLNKSRAFGLEKFNNPIKL